MGDMNILQFKIPKNGLVNIDYGSLGKCFLLIIFLLSTFSEIIYGQRSNKSGKVKVYTSSEEDEAADRTDIQPYRIFIKGNNFFEEMIYKDNQTFELDVPSGIYNVILKENVGEYIPYRRANFYVGQDKVTELRLSGFEGFSQVCSKAFGIVMLPTHTNMSKDESLLRFTNLTGYEPSNVVIRYCQKRIYKNHATYRFALLTYDNVNIYADKLTINKKDSKLKATGNPSSPVLIEAGNCRKAVNSLNVDKNSLKNIRNYCTNNNSN